MLSLLSLFKRSKLQSIFQFGVSHINYQVKSDIFSNFSHFQLKSIITNRCLSSNKFWYSFKNVHHNSHSDINIPSKVAIVQKIVHSSPQSLQPYLQLMRIDRPIGSWLLFWPCAWSLALAAPTSSVLNLQLLSIFALGSIVMRGAGCTVNDMWDKDIDKKVARTINRPLASGSINLLDAFSFLGLQLGIGCFVLLQLNWYSIILGASSLGFVFLYPLMKRITFWPQLMLGFTFNWGALIGWSAVRGSCEWSVCLPLYLAGISWTMVYDTIYAHQDKTDDLTLGIKSTAIKFGDSTRRWLTGFAVSMVSNLLIVGATSGQTWPFYAGVSAVAFHLGQQIWTLKIDNAQDCGNKFRSNRFIGWILFTSIVGGNLVKKFTNENSDVVKNSAGIVDTKILEVES